MLRKQSGFSQSSEGQKGDSVYELIKSYIFRKARIEARIVWLIKGQVMLAKVREASGSKPFRWLITGSIVPTDHIDSSVAELPRDAARHFCLKWQLGAENVRNLPHEARKAMRHLDLN